MPDSVIWEVRDLGVWGLKFEKMERIAPIYQQSFEILFLKMRSVFSFKRILRASILIFINISISKDLSNGRSPFGRLRSSKLYGMCFLDIIDVETFEKQYPNIMKKFKFQFSLRDLILRQEPLQFSPCHSLTRFKKF